MSEEMTNHGHGGHGVEFEREDLSTRGIFAFMIGLAIIGVVIYFIITGMYNFLDKYERAQTSTSSPLVTTEEARRVTSRRPTQDEVENAFKNNGAPLLETNERGQFRNFLMSQAQQLDSYGWVDEKAGIAHIPIERAMELIAQRGLPVLPQGETTAASQTAGTKKVPTKQP